jgi:hypothetical protein
VERHSSQYSPTILLKYERQVNRMKKDIDSSSLAEVVDRILDKGIVIDAYVRISLVGIELLAIDARVVIASVNTWLRYAAAVGLTELHHEF